MGRSDYLSNWPCGEPGCKEHGLYSYPTKRELAEAAKRYAKTPWRCNRHIEPDAVLSPAQPHRAVTLVASKVPAGFKEGFLPGLFWAKPGAKPGSGFTFGPGFKAWASDFPEGTRLIITAEIVLPERPTRGVRR